MPVTAIAEYEKRRIMCTYAGRPRSAKPVASPVATPPSAAATPRLQKTAPPRAQPSARRGARPWPPPGQPRARREPPPGPPEQPEGEPKPRVREPAVHERRLRQRGHPAVGEDRAVGQEPRRMQLDGRHEPQEPGGDQTGERRQEEDEQRGARRGIGGCDFVLHVTGRPRAP